LGNQLRILESVAIIDTIKELMSSSKCRSVEVINNPARPGSNHREVNYIIIIMMMMMMMMVMIS
jgi:hypothetical protein